MHRTYKVEFSTELGDSARAAFRSAAPREQRGYDTDLKNPHRCARVADHNDFEDVSDA